MNFDWNELAFKSKSAVKQLDAIFVMAPREISQHRLVEVVKQYLPTANLLIGLAKEDFVLGLDNQPQFKMLKLSQVEPLQKKLVSAGSPHQVYSLSYHQRDFKFIIDKLNFKKVLLINGSWYHGFHMSPAYFSLNNAGIPFEKISPFCSESEAKNYLKSIDLADMPTSGLFTETEMMQLAHTAAKQSFDFAGSQTGGSLGLKSGRKFELIATAHNQVVPYESYAMHFGSIREANFSPLNDMNFYDTVHYEIALLLKLLKSKGSLAGTTMFQTVLSCPQCAKMIAMSDIAEIIYENDHSDGYAVKLLKTAGKKVRRLV